MDSIRQYVLSVICMVTVCGLVQMLFQSGTTASLVKMICGLIVTIAVLGPLLKDKILQWDLAFESLAMEGELVAADGVCAANEAQKQFIKENTQTYILTKAKEMGADLAVEVQLQEDYPNIPQTVTVSGSVSPYTKRQLAAFICLELGIAEENQIWIS